MKQIRVKEIMVPLREYATIHQDATLNDAVCALEKAQAEYNRPGSKYPHRALLVYDDNNKIIGKLGQIDILRGLEPKYLQASVPGTRITASGFSPEFMKNLIKQFSLWDRPFADICAAADRLKVKDCMYVPTSGEYVSVEDTLDVAIHQLVMGHHQSLLVTSKDDIVGILRLTDVFSKVCEAIKACRVSGR